MSSVGGFNEVKPNLGHQQVGLRLKKASSRIIEDGRGKAVPFTTVSSLPTFFLFPGLVVACRPPLISNVATSKI